MVLNLKAAKNSAVAEGSQGHSDPIILKCLEQPGQVEQFGRKESVAEYMSYHGQL